MLTHQLPVITDQCDQFPNQVINPTNSVVDGVGQLKRTYSSTSWNYYLNSTNVKFLNYLINLNK